jgi:hypothetical protein
MEETDAISDLAFTQSRFSVISFIFPICLAIDLVATHSPLIRFNGAKDDALLGVLHETVEED